MDLSVKKRGEESERSKQSYGKRKESRGQGENTAIQQNRDISPAYLHMASLTGDRTQTLDLHTRSQHRNRYTMHSNYRESTYNYYKRM